MTPLSLELEEGGPAGTYTVALQSAPTSDVTVTITGPLTEITLGSGVVDLHALHLGRCPRRSRFRRRLTRIPTPSSSHWPTRSRGGDYDDKTAHLEVRLLDTGDVLLSIYDAQVDEGAGHVDLRVELNQPADQLVTVLCIGPMAEDAEAGLGL